MPNEYMRIEHLFETYLIICFFKVKNNFSNQNIFMQKYFNAKSHLYENQCECVIYFQEIFKHCFI